VIPGKTPRLLALHAPPWPAPHIVQRDYNQISPSTAVFEFLYVNPSSAIHVQGIHLSNIFRQYETVVPQLTEYDESLQSMYEELVAKLLSLDIDLSKLGNEANSPLPTHEELENRLALLDKSSRKLSQHQDHEEIMFRSFTLGKEEGASAMAISNTVDL